MGSLARLLCGLWVLALAMLAALPGAANPIPGAGDTRFVAAIDQWLADNEADALPALSGLAAEGNAAARLMLALIDTTPSLQGPFLTRQTRTDRIALMRAPGGMSGRNWLTEIDDLPLAAAWRDLRQVDTDPNLIATFTDLGERRAARLAMITLAAREHRGLRALDPDAIDRDLLYLLWLGADTEQRLRIAARVPRGDAQRARMGEQQTLEDLSAWVAQSPVAAPIRTLCDAVCPGDLSACQSAALHALGSHDALMTVGSPVESLISQTDFLSSPRGRASVLRRILLGAPMRGRRAMIARASEHAACLGAALTAEAQRYRLISAPTEPSGG